MNERQWECLLPHLDNGWVGGEVSSLEGVWERLWEGKSAEQVCSLLALHTHTGCDSCRQHGF